MRSAMASFTVGATQVDLIGTPGHSDFVAEVERVFGVLDVTVLVLSAVEVPPATQRSRGPRSWRLRQSSPASDADKCGR
ncbi:GTP-binding protein [Streptomyces sp. NPDC058000]|uniref:GTP-binding protein n=1 Tax=Streptomyces sp. NPDC058000 TaxID=3346299 RepID=UPI0036E5CAB2